MTDSCSVFPYAGISSLDHKHNRSGTIPYILMKRSSFLTQYCGDSGGDGVSYFFVIPVAVFDVLFVRLADTVERA